MRSAGTSVATADTGRNNFEDLDAMARTHNSLSKTVIILHPSMHTHRLSRRKTLVTAEKETRSADMYMDMHMNEAVVTAECKSGSHRRV